MATGRLNNRQKMINMMYLVLLAILALNVSSEVLDSFTTIRKQLQASATESNLQSLDFIAALKDQIDQEVRNQGKLTNEGLRDTLDQIRSHTYDILGQIDRHVSEMEALAQYDTTQARYRRADELERNYRYWMGSQELAADRRGNGAAAMLRDSLDAYLAYLARIYNAQVPDSARIEPLRMQDPTGNREDPGKRWEQYTFEGPVTANMATLEALRIEVLRQERRLLDLLSTRLGINTFTPDKVVAVSAPTARVVPAGMNFETDLFVGLSSSSIKPVFASPSGRLTLSADGNAARLVIPASGSVVPAGAYEGLQRYTATVQVPRATGGYETLAIDETFVVRKPELLISSAAVQVLYRDCANDLTIDVPLLGAAYQPEITASDATVQIQPGRVRQVRVVPTGRSTRLRVASRSNGQLVPIDERVFQVIAPPKPAIELAVNGQPYNGIAAVPRTGRIELRLVPDADFLRTMPQDARYRIDYVEVLLKDGLQPARVVGRENLAGQDMARFQRIDLPAAVRQAGRGAQVYLRIHEVSRLNYRGSLVADGRFAERDRVLAIPLRD
ncbi:MAG: gliding motility protein GldM [Bacteroidia bacterium]